VRVSFLRIVTGSVLASWATVSPAFGQWTVDLEIGADRYWGGSAETGGENRSFRPYRPTTFGLGLHRKGHPFGWGVQVHYAGAGLALEGPGAVAVVEGVFTVVSLSPEVAYRLTGLGPVTELRLHAGPLFEAWAIIDEDTKVRLGVQSALSLNVPFDRKLAGSMLVGVALTPSPFGAGELGPTFEPRALWRRRFAVGLQYRL
jgi:hypothetical protein